MPWTLQTFRLAEGSAAPQVRRASVQQHKEILTALQNRDGETAAQQMRSHWLSAMESSIRDVADSTGSTLPE